MFLSCVTRYFIQHVFLMENALSEEFLRHLGKHSRQIYACVYALVLNKNDADDIAQETNLVLWREFARFEPGTNFLAWARKIAVNQVLAWKTRRKRDRHVFGEEFMRVVVQETDSNAEYLADRSEFLAICIEKLPEHSRKLIAQRYDEQNKIEQIATTTNRTTEAVYRAISRIRKTLHDCVSSAMMKEMS